MDYDKDQATAEFTRWSESYDRGILQWLIFGPSHRAIIKRIVATSPGRALDILDVGCGTGIFAERIRTALPEARVWGVDLVSAMLEQGATRWRRQAGKVQPVQGDSERLPFADASFDVVTCANSFHHYPNQQRAVCEMRRVLRPGGRLILEDGYRDSLWGWFIFDVCVATVEGAVHHASRRRFRDLFTHAGFDSIVQKAHHRPAPFILNEGVAPATSPALHGPHFAPAAVDADALDPAA